MSYYKVKNKIITSEGNQQIFINPYYVNFRLTLKTHTYNLHNTPPKNKLHKLTFQVTK